MYIFTLKLIQKNELHVINFLINSKQSYQIGTLKIEPIQNLIFCSRLILVVQLSLTANLLDDMESLLGTTFT